MTVTVKTQKNLTVKSTRVFPAEETIPYKILDRSRFRLKK